MPPRTTTKRSGTRATAGAEAASGGGIGGLLRGSVTSVAGAAGLNLPLRAVERLTSAIEGTAATLERIARTTEILDELDADIVDRFVDTFEVLAAMREDTAAMRGRMDSMEVEIRALRLLIAERFDQVPLLRERRPRGGSA
ncbi:MAG: hypothetical protein ACYDAC_02320 [Candidatus Dormibacteria bacterium]